MIPVSFASVVRQGLRRFTAAQDGVSAVEFALLAPLMVTLYFGGIEVSRAVSIDRKTTQVAHTVGDLVAQVSSFNCSDISNIFSAATAVIYPYSVSSLQVTVSRVDINAAGTTATVLPAAQGGWSKTLNGSAARAGDVTGMLDPKLILATAGGTLIWSEAYYNYKPLFGDKLTGPMTFNEKILLSPRLLAVTTTCP